MSSESFYGLPLKSDCVSFSRILKERGRERHIESTRNQDRGLVEVLSFIWKRGLVGWDRE